MNNWKNSTNACFIVFLIALFSNTILGKSNKLSRYPLKFDAGSGDSKLFRHYVKLNPNDIYNSSKGYGWTLPPNYSYFKKQLLTTTMRNNLTIDGVTGKEIEFMADLPNGNWWFTFWMEAGNDYTNTVKLLLNGKERIISWQSLHPGESGQSKQMRIYRVYHTKINIANTGFKFRLIGGKDSVRISGFTLIPEDKPKTEEQLYVSSLVKQAGQYKSKTSLVDVENYLSELVDQNPHDSYFSYWQQQINILLEGERISKMMGWEWARQITHLSIFDRLKQALTLFDGLLNNFDSKDYPLREKALWYRGKILYDLHLESGGKGIDSSAKSDLGELFRKYPDDQNLQMLNGKNIDFPDPYDKMVVSEGAPRWSVLQRELYNRLSLEIDWWVNNRQAANGELGGKLGDDVELLRWWSPFLVTGNKTAIIGWRKLADAVWNSPKVFNGYSKKIYDVEHASELISDSTPELILIDNDSTYFNRLQYTADYFENLWTEKNNQGHRFFKSSWYSSTEVDKTPPRNIDVDYNARAVKPLRYLAWETRNQHYINLLHEWSLAWVDAAMRTSKGKPKGILPSSVRGYDGSFNGDGANWFEANSYWNYFDWHHSVGSKILDNIIFTYSLTLDKTLLLPFSSTLELIKNILDREPNLSNNKFEMGTDEWIVKQLIRNYGFWNVIEKWRLFTDNSSYDGILKVYGNVYTKFKLTGNKGYLEEKLQSALEDIRYNTPLRTSLVLHTDRVRTPGANLLKAMLTGDGTPESSSPYYAVTWQNVDRNFTALVSDFSNKTFTAQLFSHSEKSYRITARFWLLKEGKYNLSVVNSQGAVLSKHKFHCARAGKKVSFILPSNELINIIVEGFE